MSFILDALKKSENERQRQMGPSLADVRVSRRAADRPWWAIAVAALLVINLGVLLAVLIRKGDATPAAATPPVPAAIGEPAAAPPGEAQQGAGPHVPREPAAAASRGRAAEPRPAGPPPGSAVRSLADEAGAYYPYPAYPAASAADMAPPELSAAAAAPEGPPMVRRIEPPLVAPPSSRPFSSRAPLDNEILPTISDITASGTSLPEMHLDIHVHSTNPAERFIFVNMRKYTEGQSLNEGPVVERIRSDGVVLNHHGLRFLLPRP